MRIKFLGVGEAFDGKNLNTSILVTSQKLNFLLDLGYAIPPVLWEERSWNKLDFIFISHLHADHYFGLIPFFGRVIDSYLKGLNPGRKLPKIVTHKENIPVILNVLKHGYGRTFEKLTKEKFFEFVGVKAGDKLRIKGATLSFEETKHSVRNLAISIKIGKKKLSYSGDGVITKKAEELYTNSHILIQETFYEKERLFGLYKGKRVAIHESITNAIEIAKRKGVKKLYCVHLQRDFRAKQLTRLKKNYSKIKDLKVFFPMKGEAITF